MKQHYTAQLRLVLIITLVAGITAACNKDVFIPQFESSIDTPVIPWTGGAATVSTKNQDIDGATISIYRKTNGLVNGLENIPTSYLLSNRTPQASFSNSLLDINFALNCEKGTMDVSISHNYYPDTIFTQIIMYGEYENAISMLAILPGAGFNPGEIHYQTDCWSEQDDTDEVLKILYVNPSPDETEYTIYKPGDIITTSRYRFTPFDAEVSENIFGYSSEPLVNALIYSPANMLPSISDILIPYNSQPQNINSSPLLCNNYEKVIIAAESACFISVRLHFNDYGFYYELPAINSLLDEPLVIAGTYWLSIPVSYEITSETRPL